MQARILQLGAIAVVLVATTLNDFELDRFFVPKELVLHLTALLAGLLAARASKDRVDILLLLFLGLSVLSGVFATNPWLAMRAVAISASGIVLFWAARAIGSRLVPALALAVIAAAVTSLLQTYGLDLDFFSDQRAPGGTLGNRNFVAHVAAFGFPLLLVMTLRAQRALFWSIGSALVIASLVLTRSRAAWLAFAAVVLVFVVFTIRGHARRLLGVAALSAGAVAAALLIPNALRWRSDNPYLETMKRVADYQGGSGRGRLVQYERSLRMAAHHPLLGVGAGNWAVAYPAYAKRNDPSMDDSHPGMTFNPWPSSDWIALVSERGLVTASLLALALGLLALRALRDRTLEHVALLSVITGAVITGLFDAVLLLPIPAFLVWTSLGALSGGAAGFSPPEPFGGLKPAAPLVLLICLLGAARSASQLYSMHAYSTGKNLRRAAKIDPGNFRLQLRLGKRCAAHALYPHARGLSGGCGE
ncbi:MAG TPA: O-antigen ligase family protein [Thermoanaerobaculia bacterium]|nr:O-antigen ligase family protein [Thermoanaerobaculia bacterium]